MRYLILGLAFLSASAGAQDFDYIGGQMTGDTAVVSGLTYDTVSDTPTTMQWSAAFTVANNTVTALSINGAQTQVSGYQGGATFDNGVGVMNLAYSQGQVVGADLSLSANAPGITESWNFGSGADTYALREYTGQDFITEVLSGPVGTWTDPPAAAAPELNLGASAVALTLLCGIGMISRSRL